MEREFGPVVVGEWSLATDNCAMWLNVRIGIYCIQMGHGFLTSYFETGFQ